MADIINIIIENGGDIQLKNGWEYERLEMYEGAEPGIILGVYKRDGEHGYRLIAHDYKGRVVHADGVSGGSVNSGLELIPVKRKFFFKVKRTRVDYAIIEVEATSQDEAEDEVPSVADGCQHDIDWDEDDSAEFEVAKFIKETSL